MKYKLPTILACLLLLPAMAEAASIKITTGGSRGHEFLLSDNTTRASIVGSTVQIGYLSTPGDTSTFLNFGNSSISNPLTTAVIGGFVTNATPDSGTANPGNAALSIIAGKQLVVSVTGQNGDRGLFTSTAWTVPGTLGTASDQSFSVILGTLQGTLPPLVTALPLTGFNPATVNVKTIGFLSGAVPAYAENTNGTSFTLGAAIPEPSVNALLGLLGLVGLRRKR